MATPHPTQKLHPDQPPIVRSPIVRKTVARKPVENTPEAPPKPPRPRPTSVVIASQPVLQQQGGIHPTADHRFAQSAAVRQFPQHQQAQARQGQQGQQGQPFQHQQYYGSSQGRGPQNASQPVLAQSSAMPAPHVQPTPTMRAAQTRPAAPHTGNSNPHMQRIGSYASNSSTSSSDLNRHSQIGSDGRPGAWAPETRITRTLSSPAETSRRVQDPYYPQGQVICTHCRKGIPPNVSTYICVICSTVHVVTSFCVWCYTAGVADTSHAHHKSYYVTDSDLSIALNDPSVPSHLWTIRRNVVGRVWYTHNATGLKTHIKPTKASILESSGVPPGWEERRTPDGRTFFFHAQTGKSAWTKPSNSLPLGWKQLKTPDLVPYYINEELGLSSWDRPGQQPKYRSKSTTYRINGSSSTSNGGGDSFADGDMSLLSATKAAARLTGQGVMIASKKMGMLGKRKNLVAMGRMINQASNLADAVSGDDNGDTQYADEDYGGDSNEGDYQAEYEEDASSELQQTDYQYQPAEYSGEQSYNYDESSLAEQEPLMMDGTQEQPLIYQEAMFEQPVVYQEPVYEQQPMDQQFQNSTSIQYSDGFEPLQQNTPQPGIQDQYAEPFQVPMQTMEINTQLAIPDGPVIYSTQEFSVPDVEAMAAQQQAYTLDMMQNLDLASNATDTTETLPTPTSEQEMNVVIDGNTTTFFEPSRANGDYETAFLGEDCQANVVGVDQQAFPQNPIPSDGQTTINTSLQYDDSFAGPIPQNQTILADNTWQQQTMAPRPLLVQQTIIPPPVSPAPSQPTKPTPQASPQIDLLVQKEQRGSVQVSISGSLQRQ